MGALLSELVDHRCQRSVISVKDSSGRPARFQPGYVRWCISSLPNHCGDVSYPGTTAARQHCEGSVNRRMAMQRPGDEHGFPRWCKSYHLQLPLSGTSQAWQLPTPIPCRRPCLHERQHFDFNMELASRPGDVKFSFRGERFCAVWLEGGEGAAFPHQLDQ